MAIAKVILNGNTLMDVTSDTITAGNMLSGTTATKNDGTKATGNIASKTSSDLSASNLTVTVPSGYYASNATKTLSDANLVVGNIKKDVSIFGVTGSYEGSGGGSTGLVYETGTWSPTTDATNTTISFTNTHATAPFYFMVCSVCNAYNSTANTNHMLIYSNWEQLSGAPMYDNNTGTIRYGIVNCRYTNSSSSGVTQSYHLQTPYSSSSAESTSDSRFWVTETYINLWRGVDTYYWRANIQYKWIAVWTPTT